MALGKRVKDTDYIYAVARVKAVSNRLLSRSSVERMLDAPDVTEAAKVLQEAGWELSGRNYEKMFAGELKSASGFVASLARQDGLFDAFLLRYDYQNVKVLFKSEMLGQEEVTALTDAGTVPPVVLQAAYREREYSKLPRRMGKAVEACLELFSKKRDPQQADMLFDRSCFMDMADAAGETGVKYIRDVVAVMADTANIKTFLRARRIETFPLAEALVDGGQIGKEAFLRSAGEGLEAFLAKLQGTPYSEIIEECAEELEKDGGMTLAEKKLDNYLLDFVSRARTLSFGVEPLVAYLFLKENEIRIARIILSGKQNGIPNALIEERLRNTYV